MTRRNRDPGRVPKPIVGSDGRELRLTVRQLGILKKKLAAEEARKKALKKAQARKKRREKSNQARLRHVKRTSIKSATPGTRGDDAFYAAFIQMGSGDCAVMTTPGGAVILVDCGTNSHDGEEKTAYRDRVREVLDDKKFLGTLKHIDVLVLTHADEDHYNELANVLNSPAYTVGKAYHSGIYDGYGYNVNRWLSDRYSGKAGQKGSGRVPVQAVVLNETGTVTLQKKKVTAGDDIDELDTSGGIRILKEDNCTVTILAAGVRMIYERDGDTLGKNRGCIVLLVEAFGRKLVLCADATINTEHYLLKIRPDTRIGDVDLATVSHHGSYVTSSSLAWIEKVNPKLAVVSAPTKGLPNHHLPDWDTIKDYHEHFDRVGRLKVAEHTVYCWDLKKSTTDSTAKKSSYPLYVTGSDGTIEIKVDRTGLTPTFKLQMADDPMDTEEPA